MYVPERVGAIYPIIRTARKGRAPLSLAKLFAVLIGTSAVTLLFFASSFAVFALREGFSTIMSPIQAIRVFETCPYIITVGEYFALNTIIRLGAFLLFGCICALFASAFCDYVGSFAASAVVLAVNFILNSIKYSSLSAPAKHLNLFSITSVNEFFTRYYAAELGGKLCEFTPLYIEVVLIGSLLSLIGAFLFITYLRRTSGSSSLARFVATYLNKLRALCRNPRKNKTKVRRMKGGTLVGAEFRKLFSSRLIIALVLLILIARVAYSNSLYAGSKTSEELVYREYMEYLDGEWTEEKSEYIATESRRIEEDVSHDEAIEFLEEDPDLETIKYKKNNGYYVARRPLDAEDARLLIECVHTARFITERQSKLITKEIGSFLSEHQRNSINHETFAVARVRTNNAQLFKNIDTIHEAMAVRKGGKRHDPEKIRFKYLKCTIQNLTQTVERRNGNYYIVSPHAIIINEGNYYLLGIDDKSKKLRTYRIDRMSRVELTGDVRDKSIETDNLKEYLDTYSQRVFSMFGGQREIVRIRFTNDLLDTVVDRFGDYASYFVEDKKHFTVTVSVEISPMFFGWLCGFGNKAKIISPSPVIEQFTKHIEKMYGLYQTE